MKLNCPSRAACTMVLGTVLLVATTIFAQQLASPSVDDSATARLVCNMISRYHIGHGKVNDEVSSQLLDGFIESLDPQKLYFHKSDIDSFGKNRKDLDDQLLEGNIDFAYTVFNKFVKRVDERVEYAHDLADLSPDFTIDEEMVTDYDTVGFAADVDELNERWRKRVKYDMLTLKLDDKDIDETRDRVHKRYNTVLRSIHSTESPEVLEMYLSAMTHSFDPHSSYLSPQSMEEFRIMMKLSLDGIGAALRSEDGQTIVVSIVKGGAAEKDGRLGVGDKITAVAQEVGDFVDIVEMKLSKVVRLIRGKRGSKVRLQVAKAESGETVTYDLIRQKIELKESAVKGEVIETTDRTGRKGRIGVINVPSFYRDFAGAEQGLEDFKSTSRDLQKVLVDFRRDGNVDAIVLDLRYNGGGALSEAIEATGLFIDQGPVVQVKEPGSKVRVYSDDIEGAFNEPLIVVCNRMSASASEILAGAIKDYRRGIVVGDITTHGKGTVQNVMPVSPQMFQFFNRKDRGALKLTINQFYRVNGDSTQTAGVKSDVVLPSILDHMDIGESSLDNALEFDQIAAADFDAVAYVNADLVKHLQSASSDRVSQAADFQKVKTNISEYMERKNRQTVTLNEEKLREERKKDKEDTDDEEKDDEEEAEVFPVSAYNDELLNIALDYVEHLRSAKTAQR